MEILGFQSGAAEVQNFKLLLFQRKFEFDISTFWSETMPEENTNGFMFDWFYINILITA